MKSVLGYTEACECQASWSYEGFEFRGCDEKQVGKEGKTWCVIGAKCESEDAGDLEDGRKWKYCV